MKELRLNPDLFPGSEMRCDRILTEQQLKRLSEHKYSAGGQSLLEPFLQPYWRWLLEKIPLWVAPNLLTIAGLVVNIVSTLIIVCYSPDGKSEMSWWPYAGAALGLFIYQSLDAIDGKQARRTNSSSPLGELFDHGCDSVSMVFVTLGATVALNLGQETNWMMFENLMGYFLFYCAHWQTYVSGTLRFYKLDVTEGQMSVMSIYMLTAIFGSSFWQIQLPVLGLKLKMLPVYFSIFGCILQLRSNFGVIFMEGGVGKNGSTVAGTSTIFPLFPMAAVIGLTLMVAIKSPSSVYENHPCIYILAFGIVVAKVTNRLVVAHMTKSEMDLWDSSLLGPAMLVINQYFDCFFNEYLVLWVCLIFVVADLWRYSLGVCQEICDFLGIYCFVITSKPPQSAQNLTRSSLLSSKANGSQ